MTSVLFDDDILVQYGFAFAQPEDDEPHEDFGRDGQRNGLCGAGIPGVPALTFGMHAGFVPLRIEALTAAPPVPSDEWDEMVEASFSARTTAYVVAAFEDSYALTLPATCTFRARYSASGMDAAADSDPRDEGDTVIDRYPLQLWPEPYARPDAVLRVTGERAAYWHAVAQGLRD